MNSLDVLGPCLVCGTDAEAIYVTRHLFHRSTVIIRFQIEHTISPLKSNFCAKFYYQKMQDLQGKHQETTINVNAQFWLLLA